MAKRVVKKKTEEITETPKNTCSTKKIKESEPTKPSTSKNTTRKVAPKKTVTDKPKTTEKVSQKSTTEKKVTEKKPTKTRQTPQKSVKRVTEKSVTKKPTPKKVTVRKKVEIKKEVVKPIPLEEATTTRKKPLRKDGENKFVKLRADAKTEEYNEMGRKVQTGELQWSFYSIEGDIAYHYYRKLK
jgi:hypothetical protein